MQSNLVKFLTLRQAAKTIGVQLWQLQRIYEVNLLEEPMRVGNLRVVTETDFPQIRQALVQRGYLPPNAALETR
jgi:hypothetical protein